MAKITKRHYCPYHPAQEVAVEIESVCYDGVTDNGEDYYTETDYEQWPCPECDREISSQLVEG